MPSSNFELRRRGVRHGRFASPRVERPVAWRAKDFLAECRELWDRDRPIWLCGALERSVQRLVRPIAESCATFERLRAGAVFQDELGLRLHSSRTFKPAGATIDAGDARELEKVFVDAVRGRRTLARDLYAKLSWVAHDARDQSLRIRFSFGSEALLDWQKETRRAPWADLFALAAFPECAAIDRNAALVGLIERMVGRRVRFSERIVYSNAPGGGATFHHDDESHQLGVVFGQLAGETAWLALPKRELAAALAHFARTPALRKRAATAARALRALDDPTDQVLGRLLNTRPEFTRYLVERGALRHLRAGDVILLPSHGPDDVCWHSVFALGRAPSLAHSYGIFARRR